MSDWDLASYVMASEPRFKILLLLRKKVHTPTQLTNKIGISISRISNLLKELEEKKLIECLTKERRKHKLFSITNKGEMILEKIHEMTSKN